jgi:hypothetical protein
MTAPRATLAAALALSLAPSPASADAVMGPPTDCPRGSVGESTHTDEFCRPTTCATDVECGPGTGVDDLFCEPSVGVCIEVRTRRMGGLRPPGLADSEIVYDVAASSCATDADCTGGMHCAVASRCAPRTATEFVEHALGCTAHRSASSARTALLGAAALLTLLAARRGR